MRNRLESLVPPMELCRALPRGVFDDSALAWLHIDGEWDVYSRYEDVDGSECEEIPAPTGDEIMMRLRVCFGHCVKVNYFGRNRLVQVRCGDVVKECQTLAEAALRVYIRLAEIVGAWK